MCLEIIRIDKHVSNQGIIFTQYHPTIGMGMGIGMKRRLLTVYS